MLFSATKTFRMEQETYPSEYLKEVQHPRLSGQLFLSNLYVVLNQRGAGYFVCSLALNPLPPSYIIVSTDGGYFITRSQSANFSIVSETAHFAYYCR